MAILFLVRTSLKAFEIRPSGEHSSEMITSLLQGIFSYDDFIFSLKNSGSLLEV